MSIWDSCSWWWPGPGERPFSEPSPGGRQPLPWLFPFHILEATDCGDITKLSKRNRLNCRGFSDSPPARPSQEEPVAVQPSTPQCHHAKVLSGVDLGCREQPVNGKKKGGLQSVGPACNSPHREDLTRATRECAGTAWRSPGSQGTAFLGCRAACLQGQVSPACQEPVAQHWQETLLTCPSKPTGEGPSC